MDRRDLLKYLAAGGIGAGFGAGFAGRDSVRFFGALPPDEFTRRAIMSRPRKNFYDRFPVMRGISRQHKNVQLWKYLEREIGKIVPHNQGDAPDGSPGEGDCGAQAGSMGVDVLAAVNIHLLGLAEKFIAKSSTEMLYAASRVEIGGGLMAGGSGSRGIWVAEALHKIGVLHRIPYRIGENSIDLTGYHPNRARQYRDSGVPDWLEPIAHEHIVKEFTQVNSGREALDAMAAGQVVLFCSSYAFDDKRDAQGFTAPLLGGQRYIRRRGRQTWLWDTRPKWYHAMIGIGTVDYDGREGGTILNSHGVWNSGPQPDGLPDGAFNVETQYLDMMVKDWGDCYALSTYSGHQAALIRHRLY